MAWLHTRKGKSKTTRGQQLGEYAELPDVRFVHLINYMHDLGWSGLNWQEVRAWQEVRRVTLSSWESDMLRSMSETYATSAQKYDGQAYAAPYTSSKHHANLDKTPRRSILRRSN